MNILTAHQVNEMIHQDNDIQLVMVLKDTAFAKAHIPQSINISDIDSAIVKLPKDSKIIVYCSDSACLASYYAYKQLEAAGYSHIWRFAGGLREWEACGYTLTLG